MSCFLHQHNVSDIELAQHEAETLFFRICRNSNWGAIGWGCVGRGGGRGGGGGTICSISIILDGIGCKIDDDSLSQWKHCLNTVETLSLHKGNIIYTHTHTHAHARTHARTHALTQSVSTQCRKSLDTRAGKNSNNKTTTPKKNMTP